MIRRALDFVLSLQRPDGTISWAFEALGTDTDDALLCGNASIAKSLECGIYLAESLGRSCRSWRDGRAALVDALQSHPERFDRRKTGARYAMDWYYPVLAGIYNKTNGSDRLTQRWPEFVISGRGCRCVCDEPWVTVAESCELVMALLYTGQKDLALTLFDQVQTLRDESGVFWMGVQTEEELIWPKERAKLDPGRRNIGRRRLVHRLRLKSASGEPFAYKRRKSLRLFTAAISTYRSDAKAR